MSEVKPCVCPTCSRTMVPLLDGSTIQWCKNCAWRWSYSDVVNAHIGKLEFAAMELLKLVELPQVRRSEDAMEKISDRHDELEAEIDYWNTRKESER